MTNNDYELIEHCINSEEFLTINISNNYLLFHKNILSNQTDLEFPSSTIQKIFKSNYLSIKNARIISHVEPSLYNIIIFPDQSIVYTHKRTVFNENNIEQYQILPYYVREDLELLKNIGMSNNEIDLFVKKLDENDNIELFYSNKYDYIIQKIINFTDIQTRLKCRQVSRKWKDFVDKSSSWHYVKLSKNYRYIDRILNYFQKIDIRELDLSECLFEKFNIHNEYYVYSLRYICISIDHPLELFTLLFKIAPFIQYIKLIQTYNSSLKLKTNNYLYDCIHFIILQCQQKLKCLQRLHIQLRSVSDQIFLESSSITSIPISYEVITC